MSAENRLRQPPRPDLNPFRNQPTQSSGNRPRSQSDSLQGPNIFSDAGHVDFEGTNTFTSAGRDIFNVNPAITLSVHSDAFPSASTTLVNPSVPAVPHYRTSDRSLDSTAGEHDSEAYARLLLPKKLGWPLWQPSPLGNLPTAYRQKGVSIGDVGIITADGEFDFFFNISLPADDPINRNSVPEHFQPINHPQNPEDISHRSEAWLPGKYLSTNSVRVTSTVWSDDDDESRDGGAHQYGFTATAPAGALLMTPCGGSRENLLNTSPYSEYAKHNAVDWYKHINGTRGRGAANGSVYLITGVDKTSAWGNCVYSGLSQGDMYNLALRKANSNARRKSKFSYVWAEPNFATTNHGPSKEYFDGSTTLPSNQCLFLRGFRVALSEGLWGSIMGGVEVSPIQEALPESLLQKGTNVPFGNTSWLGFANVLRSNYFGSTSGTGGYQRKDDASSVTTIAEIPALSTDLHPSDILNQHLLTQNSLADVAITHDSIWSSVLDENDLVLPDEAELVARVWEKFEPIFSEGCVTLHPREDPILLKPLVSKASIASLQQGLLPVVKTRPRARTNPESNQYHCSWPGCTKTFNFLHELNTHLDIEAHGPKCPPNVAVDVSAGIRSHQLASQRKRRF